MGVKHSTFKSFKYAGDGLKTAFLEEPNFKIHAILTIVSITLASFLGFDRTEWAILIFTIAFVLFAELINSAVEAIVDIVSPEVQERAKVAKDVSAAAVLISALGALFIGIVLYFPKILALLG